MKNPEIDFSKIPPFYQGYSELTKGLVLMDYLRDSRKAGSAFFQSIPADKWEFAYAPGKWTLKEVLIHLSDAEKVFLFRALWFARGDQTPLPGFDENKWMERVNAAEKSRESVMEEYLATRDLTFRFFSNLSSTEMGRSGKANLLEFTPGMILYLIVGHELHHFNIIKNKYLIS